MNNCKYDDILVSVLMCVYNERADYLKLAIDSILNQTHQNIEFIIIDDGSTNEDTVQCLLHAINMDKRVSVIRNETNCGLTKSLNIGLEKCKGKYIARMDSDDYSLPDRLDIQVTYLENNIDICLVGSNIALFSDDISNANFVPHDIRYQNRELYEMSMLFNHYGPAHPTFMFRKEFLKGNNILYNENILKAQDYAIKVDILKANGHIYNLYDPVLYYRIHDRQITANARDEQNYYHEVTSFDYIRYKFPNILESDAKILSTLYTGVYNYSAREYVCALKRIIKINNKDHIYDKKILKKYIMYLWKNKVFSAAGNHKGYGGLINIFTLKSIIWGMK